MQPNDRLGSLPPEILNRIFQHISSPPPPQARTGSRLLSRSLLPWTQELLYRHIKLTHWTFLRLFVKVVLGVSGSSLASLVRQLEICCIRGWPEDVFGDNNRSQAFWLAFVKLEKLELVDAEGTNLANSLLCLDTTRQLQFLRLFSLWSELGAFVNPFDPQAWANLLAVAPNICFLHYDVGRIYIGAAVSADGPGQHPPVRPIACALKHFTLAGHLSNAPIEAASLINSFEHLASLAVIDKCAKDTNTSAVLTRMRQPRLVRLRVQSLSTSCL